MRYRSLGYRPDIDGLRGLAVLAVVAYHAFPAAFPGGYVGVDIFFVISGYLIFGLILAERAGGTFSFRNFYARRICRLFPALIVVLAAVILLGWYYMLSDEFAQLGKHTAAAAGFAINYVLRGEIGYFDAAAELKPLLHLWSLAVEEQFYIVGPLVLMLAWRLRRARAGILLLIAASGIGYNLYATQQNPAAAFYDPLVRLWEIVLGGLLAVAAQRQHSPLHETPAAASHRWREVATTLGLLLIGAAFAILERGAAYPGWRAGLPVAGTLLILAGGSGAWLSRTLLSSPVLVLIGLISYPLYLWHWPLLSILRIVEPGEPPLAYRIGAVAISFVLAWATYKFVETPIRSARPSVRKIAVLCALLAALGMVGYAAFTDIVRPRSSALGLDKFVAAPAEFWDLRGPNFALVNPPDNRFRIRIGENKATVVYFGDSIAEQYAGRVDQLLTEKPARLKSAIFATYGGCAPIPNIRESSRAACDRFVQDVQAFIAAHREIDTVVVAAAWFSYFPNTDSGFNYRYVTGDRALPLGKDTEGSELAYRALEAMLADFKAAGKKVFLVLSTPYADAALNPRTLIRRGVFSRSFPIDASGVSKRQLLARFGDVHERLKKIAQAAGATIIDPFDFLCSADQCRAVTDDGDPIYRDSAHLRPGYARYHARFIDVTLE